MRYYAWLAIASTMLHVIAEWIAPAALVSQALHLLLAPAAPLLLLALCRRSWSLVLWLGPCLVAQALVCGPWLLSSRTRPPATESGFSVLSWNLNSGGNSPGDIVREIRDLAPSIVLLQEAQPVHVAPILEQLSGLYPYRRVFGKGVTSKAYLSKVEPTHVEMVSPSGSPPYLELSFSHQGHPITIASVHTSTRVAFLGRIAWDYPGLKQLAGEFAAREHAILVGDLNTTERTPVYGDLVATGLVDSFRETRNVPGFTFPVVYGPGRTALPPLFRIDYQWHTRDLVCLDSRVTKAAGSDHLGVLAVYTIHARPRPSEEPGLNSVGVTRTGQD